MSSNKRIFYACQAVAIKSTLGSGGDNIAAADIVRGLQTVGMSSTFSLDQVFEMGQIEIYENIEDVAGQRLGAQGEPEPRGALDALLARQHG